MPKYLVIFKGEGAERGSLGGGGLCNEQEIIAYKDDETAKMRVEKQFSTFGKPKLYRLEPIDLGE